MLKILTETNEKLTEENEALQKEINKLKEEVKTTSTKKNTKSASIQEDVDEGLHTDMTLIVSD